MRVPLLFSLAAAVHLAACTQSPQQVTPKSDEDKTMYALGTFVSTRMSLEAFEFTDAELAMVIAGLRDGAKDQATMEAEEVESLLPKIQALLDERLAAAASLEKTAGAEYLAKAAAESGAMKTDSGLVYKSVTEGTGGSPTETDTVTVHYEGRLVNGTVFDSSKERGEPYTTPLNQVIPCWTEGVQKMKVGGSAQLVCPSELAYGEQGNPSIPGNSTLIFDVELLEVVKDDMAAGAAAE
jgi:FKBP-type peptidyl-prolyl cis-trans isomerase